MGCLHKNNCEKFFGSIKPFKNLVHYANYAKDFICRLTVLSANNYTVEFVCIIRKCFSCCTMLIAEYKHFEANYVIIDKKKCQELNGDSMVFVWSPFHCVGLHFNVPQKCGTP